MLIVDCHDVEQIKNELVVYVADQVAAIPSLQLHQFTLSPIEDSDVVDKSAVITSIKEFLDSINEKRNFAVISNGDVISIKSINGKIIEREQKQVHQMFSCTHCGHVTQYEVEHQVHMKIHYI